MQGLVIYFSLAFFLMYGLHRLLVALFILFNYIRWYLGDD